MKNKQIAKRTFQAISIARELNGYLLAASKPDANGYYRSPVIQFNKKWRGQGNGSYDTDSLIDSLTDERKSFHTALTNGNCYGEYTHPIYKGEPLQAWIKRCMTIDQSMESHFIKAIEPGEEIDNEVPLIMVHKPSGPYGPQLESSLRDPDKNTAYSIRCLVNRTMKNGRYLIDATKTFDHCDCPGFEVAGTRYQPHLHRVSANSMCPEFKDIEIGMELADLLRNQDVAGVHLHSDIVNDIEVILKDEELTLNDTIVYVNKINRSISLADGREMSIFEKMFRGVK